MATPTLANSPELHPLFKDILRPFAPQSERQYDGKLIEGLTDLVEDVSKPKPPQSDGFSIPDSIPTDEQRRERNAAMLLELWKLGEEMGKQAFEVQPKPDPLAIALNGFPDVNSYYAYRAGMGGE